MHPVLARRWRPRTFEQVLGQTHALKALTNALKTERLHHAYLFTGTRGVGKTTIARIFAKSLNCEQGITPTPCDQCSACVSINEGRFVDLIEVDAASRTKVEDTRDLLDNVQYAPTQGRFKVYLIDEVHMLSNHSFNALLKTLEEPPPHVKFLLATTDPQRLPVTVISRCLQFHLKAMPAIQIANYLASQLDREQTAYDPAALQVLAQAAQGSVRDALSLLDQALSFTDGTLKTADVHSMLGTLEHDVLYRILDALIAHDAGALFAISRELAQRAVDYIAVLADLISLLHRIAVIQKVPDHIRAEDQDEQYEALLRIAQQLKPADVQLYYQLALVGRRDLPLVPQMADGFEMILLRMLAFRPLSAPAQAIEPIVAAPKIQPLEPIAIKQFSAATEAPLEVTAKLPESKKRIPDEFNWCEVITALNITGPVLHLAQQCALQSFKENELVLQLESKQAALLSERIQQRLEGALKEYLAQPIRLTIITSSSPLETPASIKQQENKAAQQKALEDFQQDPLTEQFTRLFDAQIDADAIRGV